VEKELVDMHMRRGAHAVAGERAPSAVVIVGAHTCMMEPAGRARMANAGYGPATKGT
jgi:hypothetical protein